MDKNSLKKIILEKLGTTNEEAFSDFLQSVVQHLKENQTIKINDIGYFQLQKEPLSRMERRGETADKKNILVFLPLDEEKPIPLEVNKIQEASHEFDESVFDIEINKPTIISDDEINDNTEIKIEELIESGELLDNFDVMENASSDSSSENIGEEFDEFDTSGIFDDDDDLEETTNPNEITEAEINKDFLSDSDIEKIEEDISFAGSEDTYEEDNNHKKTDDGNDEIENPFDELEEFIVNDDILNDDETELSEDDDVKNIESEKDRPETVEDSKEEFVTEDEESKVTSYSTLRNRHEKPWFRSPVFMVLAGGVFIMFLIILYFSVSSKGNSKKGRYITANKTEIETVNKKETDNKGKTVSERLNKKMNEKNNSNQNNASHSGKKMKRKNSKSELTGLYRDIPNDKSITDRIYFDGERYMVQASSWRSSSIAEHEVEKLKKRGFDAFIFKCYIKSKKGTWNRVRIGYFNTKKEAEEFLRKNKI